MRLLCDQLEPCLRGVRGAPSSIRRTHTRAELARVQARRLIGSAWAVIGVSAASALFGGSAMAFVKRRLAYRTL